MKSIVCSVSEIKSSLGPFYIMADYKIRYPANICRALGEIYAEYNRAFGVLVEANREWPEDYQYAIGQNGVSCNFAVQIDIAGLDDEFLQMAIGMSKETVLKELRRKIFEIENSIAMYQLLERLFTAEAEESLFKRGWRTALDELRHKHGKPIALLAVTDQKYQAMRESEFGKHDGEELSDAEVFELSGFDKFFSPKDFRTHLSAHGDECEYLVFVRSSDPVSKLRNPAVVVEQPLLADLQTRRIIKANAITFNVDNPEWPIDDHRRINDTKWYMPTLGIAFPLTKEADMDSKEFASYLESIAINPEEVKRGQQALRFKPAQGTYGCYGHLRGVLTKRKLRSELRRELLRRGPYMVQPEMEMSTITNEGKEYTYIDRIFFAYTGGAPTFIGGFRSLIPLDSPEAKAGRNHGSKYTVWAEIL
ncbi:MAG: hypothetical protein LRZ87_01485 [Methanocellales archaeon]|nr:hypothetical protein [Methanocellales archaeon]